MNGSHFLYEKVFFHEFKYYCINHNHLDWISNKLAKVAKICYTHTKHKRIRHRRLGLSRRAINPSTSVPRTLRAVLDHY